MLRKCPQALDQPVAGATSWLSAADFNPLWKSVGSLDYCSLITAH